MSPIAPGISPPWAMIEAAVMSRSDVVPPFQRERFEADATEMVERVVADPVAAAISIAAFRDDLPDFEELANALAAMAETLTALDAPAAAVVEAVTGAEQARAAAEALIGATVGVGFDFLMTRLMANSLR